MTNKLYVLHETWGGWSLDQIDRDEFPRKFAGVALSYDDWKKTPEGQDGLQAVFEAEDLESIKDILNNLLSTDDLDRETVDKLLKSI